MKYSEPQKNYRNFSRWLYGAIALWLLGFTGFNIAIDPYGLFNTPEISGVNRLKPKQFGQVRMFKATDVIRQQPKAVILGSSRVDIGIDPSHPKLASFDSAYNLGLLGANMNEVRQYFEHTVANQPDLEMAIIGLDFFMFNEHKKNEANFRAERLQRRQLDLSDVFDATLSIDAVESSLETIAYNVKPFPTWLFHSDGQRYNLNPPPLNRQQDFVTTTRRLLEQEGYYKDHELSEQALADLQAVVDLAADQNIDLRLFISPPHATLMESMRSQGLRSRYEDWKRAVVAINPVWDFSGYNRVTTEPFNEAMVYYVDSSHYSNETGNLILERILSDSVVQGEATTQATSDFGVWLTPETVEAFHAQTASDRDRWLASQTDDLQLVYQPNDLGLD